MHIVCASSVLLGEEAFSTLGDVSIIPERNLTAQILREADVLITRSGVRVDRALLEDSRVRFVGTATAGFDHFDVDCFHEADIAWAHAPGCNARSVAEYVVCALLCLAERHHLTLAHMTLGVIGVGEIGRRVVRLAEALGMTVLQNDPPRFLATGDPTFCPLPAVLANADIVTLHVPLTAAGPFPTRHMADCRFFAGHRPGGILINTARGEVVDTEALLTALDSHAVAHAVLDVWEGEPHFRKDLLERVDLGTPHIAGHSLEGKLAGTVAVYRAACHFFEEEPVWAPALLSEPAARELDVEVAGRRDEEVLGEIARAIYDIEADDRALRDAAEVNDNARAANFVMLRLEYPVRREFNSLRVHLLDASPELRAKVKALGFELV
ncbi:MAG: 4-phosphoerythronate dehydrogenase [Kiritimatiellae bacterium]|nr:4-phosphoerythronate dehydrogenase [Kiritimatiellia bacterium]